MKYRKIFLLMIITFFFAGEAAAKEITVQEGMDLQKVLDEAEKGDTVALEAGVYEGNFSIDKTIALIGETGAKVIGPPEGNVITVNADDVVIENLEIEGGGTQNAGIYIRSNRNKVTGNRIYDVFHGVMVKDGYGNEITNNMMSSFRGNVHKGFGVYLIEAPSAIVSENIMYDTNDGVYISFSDLCAITNNYIRKARYGVHTMDSEDIVISQNDISESRNGLMIMQSYYVRIKDNYLHDNRTVNGAGMFIFDTFYSTISQNVMERNNKGIYLENAQNNNIVSNIIRKNDTGLEMAEASINNLISLNQFIGNNQQVISDKENENSFTWDDFGNYWDNLRAIDLDQDKVNDFAYKSGDVFYHMTKKEPHLQIFTGSPAIQLWNTIEKYVPIPSEQFIVDEHPLVNPSNIEVDFLKTGKKDESAFAVNWSGIYGYASFVLFGIFAMGLARRKKDAD